MESQVILATMHGKERAIAGPFQRYLNATIRVPDLINTDQFGTFSGEIQRVGTPREAAKAKIQQARSVVDSSYYLASEGTFGPCPYNPFAPSDHELLVLYDVAADRYHEQELLSMETNFDILESGNIHLLDSFLKRAKFPTHAMNLIDHNTSLPILKGVMDVDLLMSTIDTLLSAKQLFQIQTDMRAHLNPTRMQVIAELAEIFAIRLATPCPGCHAYGFGVKKAAGHLPCSWCEGKTSLYACMTVQCPSCDYVRELPRPDGKVCAEPAFCFYCNP